MESYLASIGKKAEDIRADYAKQAKDAISIDLILSEIAKAENIKIEGKDIDAALAMSQIDSKTKTEDTAEIENRKRMMESILKRRSALDFLINLG